MISRDTDPASPLWRRVGVTLVVGVGAGVGGLALSLLLHAVQHLAYGYALADVVTHETFLEGVDAASDLRRLQAMLACGLIAGIGWWLLARYARPRVGIAAALASDEPRMPGTTTVVHALLQIVTVGLGSPLGREVAPREIGAAFAAWVADRAALTADERRVMLACGAGAGLAAVYNVPMAGAVFTIEVLLRTFAWRAALPAIATSAIAAMVPWGVLGDVAQYAVPAFEVDASLIAWAIVAGPIIGIAAHAFRRATAATQAGGGAPGWRRALLCVVVFAAIGWLAGPFPQILGNGKGPAQLSFDGDLPVGIAAVVLALKVLVVMAALRVGAHGGLLTPGLSCGALLAVVLGAGWSMVWPGPATGAFAIVGAAAFLAASMAMPLTAVLLLFEFTGVGHDFVVPILFAVAGSFGCSKLCESAQAAWRRARAAMATPRGHT